jgi:hypothetical protein
MTARIPGPPATADHGNGIATACISGCLGIREQTQGFRKNFANIWQAGCGNLVSSVIATDDEGGNNHECQHS